MSESSLKQRYKSCRLIEHGLMFDHCNLVRVCSIVNKEHGGKPIIFHGYCGEKFDIEKFYEIKRHHRELMKNGTPPKECIECHFLEEDDWDNEDYIDNLLFAHWIDCNSKCIYCIANEDTELRQMNKHYDIYPAIEDLVEKGVLKTSGKVDFAGGEPTIFPEFEKLLTLFVSKDFHEICVNTSGIKYSPAIENVLLNGKRLFSLTISVDAGSKEIHEKVKRVKSYDKVWANIEKYSDAQMKSGKTDKITLKYLVVPDVNDKIEEFDLFLQKVIDCKITKVALSLDMFWYEQHKNEDNSELNEKFDYFIQKAQDLGLYVHIYPWAKWSMEDNVKRENV